MSKKSTTPATKSSKNNSHKEHITTCKDKKCKGREVY